MQPRFETANEAWLDTIAEILKYGREISPRGLRCFELVAWKSQFKMTQPLITIPNRKLGYRFAAAEAAWILSGDNRVETITPYSKDISRFSDDGILFFGAYGPQFVDQIGYVAKVLATDQSSRQAVMTIWRRNPMPTKDVPCTVSVQWLLRDGKLHCIDTMRSSDTWLGWVYDVFNWTMASAYLALYLRHAHGVVCELGTFTMVAGSQHLYENNLAGAGEVLKSTTLLETYPDFTLDGFNAPGELVEWLWVNAANRGALAALKERG